MDVTQLDVGDFEDVALRWIRRRFRIKPEVRLSARNTSNSMAVTAEFECARVEVSYHDCGDRTQVNKHCVSIYLHAGCSNRLSFYGQTQRQALLAADKFVEDMNRR